jgi:Rieske Fe-S protein
LATLGVAPSAFAEGVVRHMRSVGVNGALHSYAIPDADGVYIDHDNDVILVRWERAVYAFNLSCPHQNTALRWNQSEHRFQCPKHKSKYRPDGQFIEGRATRGMDRLAVKRDGNNVVVDLDRMFKQDADPAGWNAAVVAVTP